MFSVASPAEDVSYVWQSNAIHYGDVITNDVVLTNVTYDECTKMYSTGNIGINMIFYTLTLGDFLG